MRSNCLAVLLWSLCAATATAGTLGGRVIDPDGKPVQRLESDIVAVNAAGQRFIGKVDRDGGYRIEALPQGVYTLDLDLPTRLFERYARAGVEVPATGSTQLDLRLEWGMNLGTVGDDPLLQGSDLRARTTNIDAPAPRTPDGKPDLSGIWTNFGDSYAGAAPMKPWAQALFDQWRQIKQDNPGAYCLPQSGLMTLTNYPYKFVQTPTLIVQLVEDMVISHRQIHLDGRGHPPADQWNPSWYGHSIGWWEGDTLVVETTNFHPLQVFRGASDTLKVIERFTRVDADTILYRFTIDDPETWVAPWGGEVPFRRTDEQVFEYACHEGNYALANILSGARAQEREAATKKPNR